MRTMSADAARRTALAAQGFTDPRPTGPVDRRHLARVLGATQLLQLDSVNVAVRAHYAPLFSRLGPYPTALLDEAAWPVRPHAPRRPRMLVEAWAHEASLVPVADWPLVGRGILGRTRGTPALAERHRHLVADLLDAVAELGPVGAGALEAALAPGGARGPADGGASDPTSGEGAGAGASRPSLRRRPPGSTWWERSDVKRLCEHLFATGGLAVGGRRHFERLYDLPQRVLSPDVLATPTPDHDEAARALLRRAARAHGVATEPDLRDHYRMPPAASRAALAELVDAGELEPVAVPGWPPAYRRVGAPTPRRVVGRALLCPFDPLVWRRERAERLFGFRYRIEIYVPEALRVYGYYVFPFLLDGHLVARVDLKADRAPGGGGALLVRAAHAEPSVHAAGRVGEVAAELAGELASMASWLGLERVVVAQRGDLAAPLASAARAGGARATLGA